MFNAESIHRVVLESMEHGFVFYNREGEIALFNKAACRILGVAPEELKGKTSYDRDWKTIRENGDAFPPDLHPIMVSLKKGTPCFGVVMGITTGKSAKRWLFINSDVVKDEESNEILGAVASFSDITQQINHKKYLERSLEASEAAARAMSYNAGYMKKTLLSLTKDIAEAIKRTRLLIGDQTNDVRAEIDLIEKRATKLVLLLEEKDAA
ncbi:MAG: PAS domain S-box protein [Alphaproteobacteria bacterium]|nr:PAS domain S-box protein [Alphaproteobacteria bacterium]